MIKCLNCATRWHVKILETCMKIKLKHSTDSKILQYWTGAVFSLES